ncbi:MAG: SEC-C metal-binding domain-containing protein [Spirochaetales bacterium]|nr:SEC-C metal-binding domain-containing protein [Spirochaetales bacterium]
MNQNKNRPDVGRGEPFAFRLNRDPWKGEIFVCVTDNLCDNPACGCMELGMAIFAYPGEGEELNGPPVYTFVLDIKGRTLAPKYSASPESRNFAETFLDHCDRERWGELEEAAVYLKEEALKKKRLLKGSSDSMAGQIVKLDEAKQSRNAPCPCGSGKKYKHCCG